MRWLLITLMVLGLAACGKKGDLLPPGGGDSDGAALSQPLEDTTFRV